MRSKRVSIPRRLLRTAMIFCISALFFASVGLAFAKYHSAANGSDSASVAQFSPSLTTDQYIDISNIKNPGNSREVTFHVGNTSDGHVSEVAMKYRITLKTTGNLPLHFTLKDSEGSTVSDDWTCDGTSGEKIYEYQVPSAFAPGVPGQHDYTLTVEWPEEKTDARFAGMTDAVYLSVTWEQID